MNEFVTWIALFAAVAALAALLRMWQSLTDRIGDAQATAKGALEDARDAKGVTGGLSTSLAANIAAFAIYREQIAKEYITRDMMREFEQRVSVSARENADRLSGEIRDLSARFDSILLAIVPKKPAMK